MTNSDKADEFFSSPRFLSSRDTFLEELSKSNKLGNTPNFKQLNRLMSDILHALGNEFDNKCGYCGRHVGITSSACLDHFFPKYRFPERAFDHDNLILACQACNLAKRDQFPLDTNNNPLLLNPRVDNFRDHLSFQEDGTIVGLSPRGEVSIQILRLNRSGLVDERRREYQYELLAAARPELRAALLEDNSHSNFLTSVASVRSLNSLANLSASNDQPFRLMLYANLIACLETYLGDTLIATVKSDRNIMRKFVETFHDFKFINLTLTEVFNQHELIDKTAIEAMANVLYHNIPKVKGMYQDALGVGFPKDIGSIMRAINIRHDIVHRNGKNKDGTPHILSARSVEELADQITQFVAEIQRQIEDIRRRSMIRV